MDKKCLQVFVKEYQKQLDGYYLIDGFKSAGGDLSVCIENLANKINVSTDAKNIGDLDFFLASLSHDQQKILAQFVLPIRQKGSFRGSKLYINYNIEELEDGVIKYLKESKDDRKKRLLEWQDIFSKTFYEIPTNASTDLIADSRLLSSNLLKTFNLVSILSLYNYISYNEPAHDRDWFFTSAPGSASPMMALFLYSYFLGPIFLDMHNLITSMDPRVSWSSSALNPLTIILCAFMHYKICVGICENPYDIALIIAMPILNLIYHDYMHDTDFSLQELPDPNELQPMRSSSRHRAFR